MLRSKLAADWHPAKNKVIIITKITLTKIFSLSGKRYEIKVDNTNITINAIPVVYLCA